MADARRVQDSPRDRGHKTMRKRDKLDFRQVARQVMLANMFTKIQTNAKAQVRAKMPAEGGERSTIAKTQELLDEKPLRRRGTPELFPMSEEMRQTIIALGKLDLLPDEEKHSLEDEKSSVTNKCERNKFKFRDQTRRRIITPQRFIRNVRSSLNDKNSVIRENTAEQGIEDDRDFKEGSVGKINWLSDKERRKTNYHVLSRRHTTMTAKSPRNLRSQYSLTNMPPLYFTRSSDLGTRTAKATPRRTRRQEAWPVGAFPESYISSSRAQKRLPNGDIENPITAWTKGIASSTRTSTHESVTKGEKMVETRRWKSGEMLATEIEEKCLEWLENRYGIPQ